VNGLSVKQRVGMRIRAAREAAHMTQEQLADRIGLKRSSVANIELGNQDMPVTRLAYVAEVLNLDLADLVRSEDLPSPPHDVTIRRIYEIECATCGAVIDGALTHAGALESKRQHIAQMREAKPS
jgi:transcriptional regulator with XRE-family HTH domain